MTDKGDPVSHKLQMLVLERRDASVNMARFYVLAIEPTLFGDTAVVREWGRIGSLGRRRLDLYPDSASAAEAFDVSGWLERRGVAIESERQAYCPDRRRRDADAMGPKWSSLELPASDGYPWICRALRPKRIETRP